MTYDDAIMALSNDAVKLVKNNQTIGLGSGTVSYTHLTLPTILLV